MFVAKDDCNAVAADPWITRESFSRGSGRTVAQVTRGVAKGGNLDPAGWRGEGEKVDAVPVRAVVKR